MPLSGEEARERALEKIGELRRASEELSILLKDIPIPTPAEFDAMRSGEAPWTLEAYIAAVIREADFHVDQGRVVLDDYGQASSESLAQLWRNGQRIYPSFERSLRYLVEERAGMPIPPSLHEELFFNPDISPEALLRRLLERAVGRCLQ